MILRICIAIIILGLIAWAPWWLVMMTIVVATIYYDRYYEAALFGVILDAVYGISLRGASGTHWLIHIPISYTLGIILAYSITFIIKQRLRPQRRDVTL